MGHPVRVKVGVWDTTVRVKVGVWDTHSQSYGGCVSVGHPQSESRWVCGTPTVRVMVGVWVWDTHSQSQGG